MTDQQSPQQRGADRPLTRSERRRLQRAERHPVRTALTRGARAVSMLLAGVLLLGSGMTFVYYKQLTSKAATAASVENVEGNVAAEGFDGRDMDILMIGTDTRTGTDIPAEAGSTGDDLHNTDTIMLIHVPADGSRASIVSFPRDTWVQIANRGEKAKINSAYAYGYNSVTDPNAPEQARKDAGQQWLIQTISAFTGVQIDHFVEVTLAGFRDLTKAVGGVDVNLCEPTEDLEYSGANFPAGKQHLDENQALSFVRQRHGLKNGDLDRIKRQQYFMAQILRKVLDREIGDLFDPAKLSELIDALAGTISYDPELSPLLLAEQMRDVAAGNVEFRTIPLAEYYEQRIGGQDVVVPADEAEVLAFFQSLSAPAPSSPGASSSSSAAASGSASSSTAAPPTSAVPLPPVLLYLGTADPNAQQVATADLQAKGYPIEATHTASLSYDTTEIQYAPDQAAAAAALQAQLPGSATRQVGTTPPGKLLVVVGANYPGLAGASGSASPTTSVPPVITAATDDCIY